LTWASLPVASRIIECDRPFSFYFGLIEPHWQARASVDLPIHRLTTLARKQGARTVVIEDAAIVPHVIAEIDAIDAHHGGGGAAEALKISFLRCELINGNVTASPPDVIGQCVVVNYRAPGNVEFVASFVLEALFALPTLADGLPLLNNYVSRAATFPIHILDQELEIAAVCYAQQNTITSVCAHACLHMVERTLFPKRAPPVSSEINTLVGNDAIDGMLPQEMAKALRSRTGSHVREISCEGLTSPEFVSILTAATESGHLALLVFKTGASPDGNAHSAGPTNHVVVVLGHTRNSDEWHPQAIPEYSGLPSAPYCPASGWVDHFLINDDNFGPYFTLSSRALESDPTVRAEAILVVQGFATNIDAHTAEAAAATFLSIMLPTLSPETAGNRWLDLVTRRREAFVTRPILLRREQYVEHLRCLVSHDGATVVQADLESLEALPDHFWMVEYTIPDLLAGNRSKLGEVLVEASWNDDVESRRSLMIRGLRAPSRLLIADHGSPEPSMTVRPFPLASHGGIYVNQPHGHEW
jgi:hypothetical protein